MRLPPITDLPPMPAPVSVVGDVHLDPREPDVASRFLAYLDRVADQGGTLVLLGDLFDHWYGPPQADGAFTRPILERLDAVRASGVRLAFLPGNRDFLFGLGGVPDIEIWPDPVRTTWGDRRVVLTHGDLLCTADHGYQALRRLFRGSGGGPRLWMRAVPSRWRRYFAEGLRDVSGRETRKKPATTMDIDYGAAGEWLAGYEAEVLVAGHVHTGVHHRRDGVEVLVLKDWEGGGGVVRFDGERVRLVAPDLPSDPSSDWAADRARA